MQEDRGKFPDLMSVHLSALVTDKLVQLVVLVC
jgi:hypothetical protein